ncbi:hypothetical protein RND81_04G023300 [Saponaria officinalis]|uniref:Retrotransposon Copia-like N-terminal domain-containing protein n=1 Tax=Saponaria officinalis TaxID=3572 RepID=A0AAW1LGV5_SAPOF
MGDKSNQQLVSMDQMLQLFKELNKPSSSSTENTTHSLTLTEKLNHHNYAKWARLMYLAISGRGRLQHITAAPPNTDDTEYPKWVQRDSQVFSWIIENINSDIVNQFLDYPTAKELWKGIETLYSSGKDELQIYDLATKVGSIKQGKDSIEVFYGKLISIWKEIDRRTPSPMKCPEDITAYNNIIQRQRLYQLLAGINDSLDKERRDLLHQDPLPTVEMAYAQIRWEILRRSIMYDDTPPEGTLSSEIGAGLAKKGKQDYTRGRRGNDDKAHLKCTHCGGTRHTKEGCFKIVGYPEWWPDLKKRTKDRDGRANITEGVSEKVGKANNSSEEQGCSDGRDHWAWY